MRRYPLGLFPVSRIGFGAMQLPGPGVFGPPRDRAEALAVLRRAVDLGVDHIDTAQYYGPDVANELIREALHPYPGTLALVSKVGARRDASGGWLPYDEPASSAMFLRPAKIPASIPSSRRPRIVVAEQAQSAIASWEQPNRSTWTSFSKMIRSGILGRWQPRPLPMVASIAPRACRTV
jgi:aryl-alcohol dehydrogenase-like predicted oxidoreductase